MASFISALSLLILVLANGYFAIPLFNEPSSSPFLSLHDDLTTENPLELRSVPDNDETTESPTMEHVRATDEDMGSEMSTSGDNLSEENASQPSRMFDESFTSEPMTFTSEKSSMEERDFKDLSFTTVEPFTHSIEHERRELESEKDTETDEENKVPPEVVSGKRDIPIESTTISMLSFTSTSSAVAPQFYTSESSTTTLPPQFNTLETSTKNFTGFLKDDKEHDEETEKPIKTLKKQPTKTKFQSDEESFAPIAVLDQQASKEVSPVSNGVMILDENNDLVVTATPDKLSKINTENKKQLNQGEKSTHSEEKKSDNWNGSSLGWILFSPTYLPTTTWKIIN